MSRTKVLYLLYHLPNHEKAETDAMKHILAALQTHPSLDPQSLEQTDIQSPSAQVGSSAATPGPPIPLQPSLVQDSARGDRRVSHIQDEARSSALEKESTGVNAPPVSKKKKGKCGKKKKRAKDGQFKLL
jgi:hypothetical protein